jgi:hypothetical protein
MTEFECVKKDERQNKADLAAVLHCDLREERGSPIST